jgi:hypothetical protein
MRAEVRRADGGDVDAADAENARVFLETSALENVEFYVRLGFVTVGECTIPKGGPHVWAMTRGG